MVPFITYYGVLHVIVCIILCTLYVCLYVLIYKCYIFVCYFLLFTNTVVKPVSHDVI